jgi:hypothetical protein
VITRSLEYEFRVERGLLAFQKRLPSVDSDDNSIVTLSERHSVIHEERSLVLCELSGDLRRGDCGDAIAVRKANVRTIVLSPVRERGEPY